MANRVVITGVGMVTPLGIGTENNWQALLRGESGLDYITLFDASKYPTKVAGEVRNFDVNDFVDDPARFEHTGRNTKFAAAASEMAWKDGGLKGVRLEPARVGVYLGSGEGQLDFDNFVNAIAFAWNGGGVDVAEFCRRGLATFHKLREMEQEPSMPAGHVAALFNACGPNSNCLTACAASSQAIGEATEIIRRGDADLMISGGTHSMIHPLGMAGFNLLTALSTYNGDPKKASRPFDLSRDGFVLGEGAGIVILEELSHAKRRGARILAELAGYGSTADAYRITDTHPEGRGAIDAMKEALADAGVAPTEVDYINAHGTSTVVNDKVETLAIKRVFGDYAYEVPVSSIKSMLGHLIAAAGAVEVIACALAIRDGVVPPTINYQTPDPDCDLDYVPNEARQAEVKVALSNSFGFGGQNIALVVREFAE
ncbi:MAG: beta-ketoacyl-ACP synthase II [Planctomycetota bacterium]